MGLEGVNGALKWGTGGCKGLLELEGVTRGYRRLQGVTRDNTGLQSVT